MEKTRFLTVLAVLAVLGHVSSVPSSKFLLRELIRELEDAQGENPASTAAPSDVEDELANVEDLAGLKDNGGEEETAGDEGGVVQEDNDGQTEQGGDTAEGDDDGEETEQGAETAGEGPATEGPTEGEDDGEGETDQGDETVGGETTGDEGDKTAEVAGGDDEEEEDGTKGEEAKEEHHVEKKPAQEGENGGENQDEDDHDEASEAAEGLGEHPNVHDEIQAPGPISKAPKDESGRPSELERSAVRMSRLLDNLSRRLSNRADILGRIDKVLMDGPEIGYPSINKLAEKQEKLEIMAAKVDETKKVLSRFFDDVFDRFDGFVSDDQDEGDMDEIKPVMETKPLPQEDTKHAPLEDTKHAPLEDTKHAPLEDTKPLPHEENKPLPLEENQPEKEDSADVEQKKLLKRLLGVLEKDTKRKI